MGDVLSMAEFLAARGVYGPQRAPPKQSQPLRKKRGRIIIDYDDGYHRLSRIGNYLEDDALTRYALSEILAHFIRTDPRLSS
ncbi:hypothetical protein WI38_32755 [Burkholderia ubonensis]|uniref:Uncharacterized protein n=1 Tax=Burkholderia ubonensis TaxID=101571 RepID=A0A117XZG4_9BURK|nr:hypothetical protein [Burkholderia ubonensis]KUZ70697.1 hypothetical protein WI35_15580 [Burkholderia ubonensis]KUZ80951.1 hypothetical protein WI38_32755 [Burkholderia ubonensis]KVA02723.1 hypothetical protein WI39_33035 [Burkholderia ubonensis]